MLQKLTLPNGIQVVAYHMPSVRSFHLRVSVKGGSLVEEKRENGVAHFMEHILVQGIPSYPTPEALSEFIEGLAGNYNAYTSQLLVSFSITVPSIHAKDAVQIASEVFFHPLFNDHDIERERHVVTNEIKQDMDSRWYIFGEFFREKRFVKQSKLRLKTVGSLQVIDKLSREDILRYWREYFFPKNTYVLIIGNLKNIDIEALLMDYFKDQVSKRTFVGFKNHGDYDLSERTVAIRHDEQLQVNYLDLTYPSLAIVDDLTEKIKESIAHVILGGLSSSRLFRLLRHQRGLVYGVTSQYNRFPHTGYGSVSSEVATEKLEEVLQLIVAEFKRFVQTGPTEEEVTFTKHYLTNGWLMSFDHPSSVATWIESELLWKKNNEEILLPDDYIGLLASISPKSITEMMYKRWDFSKLNLIIQGPVRNTKANREKYTQIIGKLR
ncbi:MAG: insulinase family protein [Candidatus Levybacteria bacterium]|nr:insulinase family protein [Candidatus Levybacteria bacterium]